MNENNLLDLDQIYKTYEYSSPYQKVGKICSSRGTLFEVNLPKAVIGSGVEFVTEFGTNCLGEIVAINGHKCMAMPYEDLTGINSETRVYLKELTTMIRVGDDLLGRVVDFRGLPIDGHGEIKRSKEIRSIFGKVSNPLERREITEIFDSGINAINAFMTIGKGQRIAIMAGSGVGKSITLGMIAQKSSADINVIALIGERGREVLEFIQNDLGSEGMKKSVVICATSDTSPLIRIKAAFVATTIAEYFRDKDNDVLFMMDSITRFAMAQREISLSVGDPPGPKGYTPMVFSSLPKLLERAGQKEGKGSITGIYTVLVEGGDMEEPITDAVRGISDGHIILSRELAVKSQFPPIDILESLSRLMNKIVSDEHKVIASYLRDLISSYRDNEDLINIGAYAKGSNPKVDKAIFIYEPLMDLLKQIHGSSSPMSMDDLYENMVDLSKKAEEHINKDDLAN